MVTVILRGGLGNQMFQYAAGLNLALTRGDELYLDTTFLNDRSPRRHFTYRTYDLDVFDLDPKFTKLARASSALPIPGVWLGSRLVMMHLKKILKIGKNPILWGFYQGESYFKEHQAAVRATFHFRYPLEGQAAALAQELRRTNSVSLHVRRGDYLRADNIRLFGVMNKEYYDRGIQYIAERVKEPYFFIFSDDIAWCRENIKPPFPTTYVDETTRGPKDSFHLHLMSLCKHNIIANSSFSWWGAWLNESPGKIVIGPERWQEGAESVLPPNWVHL